MGTSRTLNVFQYVDVLCGDEVNYNAIDFELPALSCAIKVVGVFRWEIVVDDE